jgi:hypothetical protein
MKKSIFSILFVLGLMFTSSIAIANQGNSCWGQASAVFAQMGVMGEHSSEQDEPRLGLANLARALFDAGVLAEPTLAALGAFVASELGLDIDRCTHNAAAVEEAEASVAANAACWGQASAVFAQMGVLGEHSSQQPNPRLGLRNLARALADMGVIPDDSMASLGAFVAAELGLEIDACS